MNKEKVHQKKQRFLKKNKIEIYNRELACNQKEKEEEHEIAVLRRKIDFITKTCSISYFNKILKRLLEENKENTNIICNYIAEDNKKIKSSSKISLTLYNCLH